MYKKKPYCIPDTKCYSSIISQYKQRKTQKANKQTRISLHTLTLWFRKPFLVFPQTLVLPAIAEFTTLLEPLCLCICLKCNKFPKSFLSLSPTTILSTK